MCLPTSWWVIYNAPVHTALSIQQFFTQNGMNPMPHLPYSPDLTPSNCFLFVCLFVSLCEKSPQRETFCQCGKGETMAEVLKDIKIDKFKNCFEQWKKSYRCISSNEEYSESV